MKKKVFITGGSGFIGKNFLDYLSKFHSNLNIALFSRKSINYKPENLKVDFYQGDLINYTEIYNAIKDYNPSSIIHLATCYSDGSSSSNQSMLETNLIGSNNIFQASSELGIKQVINFSSSFIYGNNDNASKETTVPNPLNLYAISKVQTEQYCDYYAKKSSTQFITLRLFHVYGPHDHNNRLIPYVINNLLKNKLIITSEGFQEWDLIYVEDISKIILKIINKDDLNKCGSHEIFNLGTGKTIKLKEVIKQIFIQLKVDPDGLWETIPNREDEIWLMEADISKLNSKLLEDFVFVSIEEGIFKTISGMMSSQNNILFPK